MQPNKMGQCYVAVNCIAPEKNLVAFHVQNNFILSFHIDFNSSIKEEASAESCVGGGELFEKFQQKQKNNKETTNSMGGKR